MATNLEVGKYKNIGERTCVAPSLNLMFVPSNRNKQAVAKCCAQLVRVEKCRDEAETWGWGEGGVGPAENASSFFAAFCDSQKTLEKMAQPTQQANFFLVFSFLSSRVPRASSRPKPHLNTRRYSMSIAPESLLLMSICKTCPSQPFLFPK